MKSYFYLFNLFIMSIIFKIILKIFIIFTNVNMNDITKRIAEIMKKKKISASDLSKKINVQKSSISHILKRKKQTKS